MITAINAWRSRRPISISTDTMVGARGHCYCWVGMKVPALSWSFLFPWQGRVLGCLVTVT